MESASSMYNLLFPYIFLQLIEHDEFFFFSDDPGLCPPPAYSSGSDFCLTARFAVCSHSSDCNKHEKCCHNGCAHVCMPKAMKPNQGQCPDEMMVRGFPCGRKPCSHDSDCRRGRKCCNSPCGYVCTNIDPRELLI
uniref:WAP domain-containing protein n=1 Tax=Salarias fasciatus TaxID=181472 RepID=A0A672IRG3_SALFA